MAIQLKTKPGINGANVLAIPKDWDPVWFRHFVNNQLKGADVRNAVGAGGITISGNISSPYATIGFTGGGGVTQIIAGTNITISPPGGTGVVTINSTGGGGGTALPGTIPDLNLWWESDNILGANGALVSRLQERTPWITGVAAISDAFNIPSGSINAASLNSLNTLTFSTNASGGYTITSPFILNKGVTIFIILNPASNAALEAVVGGNSASTIALYQNVTVGVSRIGIVNTATAVLATSTATWTVGTFFQANVTYDPITGVYAFRQSRAAAGTGAVTAGLNLGPTTFIGSDSTATSARLSVSSLAAVIIYNRVLTGPEIASIENYLFAKWGI